MPAIADVELDMANKRDKPLPNRTGRPFALYIAADVDAGLERLRALSELPASLNATINHALREYLKSRGLIPKAKGQGPRRPPDSP